MTSAANHASAYRPDIDGLRAIAVLGVLLYHIDHGLLGGGFVGVDVFFVISGFLITSLMIKDLESGKFSIAYFYERRIRRILPAMFCMITACCVAACFILLPDDLESFAQSAKYAAISLPNLYFLREIEDYFGPEISRIPLLHTWSLGVEEQFYIVFPVLLTFLFRLVKKPGSRLVTITAVFIASLVAACVMVPLHPQEAFFLLPYRAWELMLGAWLAVAKLSQASTRWNHAAGVIGLALVLGSMVIYAEETPFPGLAALPPCIGAGLLILSGSDPRAVMTRMLSWKPLVFIGLISYSVYLWHWPLLVFAEHSGMRHSMPAALFFFGSLLVGALSWRFIEQPFRKADFGTRRMAFAAWASACVLLIGYGHAARWSDGFSNRFSAEVLRVLEFKNWATAYRSNMSKNYSPEKAPVYGAHGVSPDIAIWGDSHARAFLPVLDVMAKKQGRAIRRYGMNGVPPVVGATPVNVRDPAKVSAYTARTLEILASDASIKTVILAARWSIPPQSRQGGGVDHWLSFHERSFGNRHEMESYYASQIKKTVDSLLASGKKVLIIEPVPESPFNVPDEFAKALHQGRHPEVSIAITDYADKNHLILDAFDQIGPSNRLFRIKPRQKLIADGRLLLWFEGKPLYADKTHLSSAGVFYLEELLAVAFAP